MLSRQHRPFQPDLKNQRRLQQFSSSPRLSTGFIVGDCAPTTEGIKLAVNGTLSRELALNFNRLNAGTEFLYEAVTPRTMAE